MIHWGVLGTGNIAVRFARSIAHLKNAEITAVSGRNPEHTGRYAAQFGIRNVFSSHEELLAAGADAVYIALPHGLHARYAEAALEKGIPVLSEKPACLNAAEMESVADAAERTGVLYMEAMKTRFEPAYAAVRNAVQNGEIGELKEMRLSDCFLLEPALYGRTYHTEPGQGGALLDCGCYCLSWIQDFCGADTVPEIKECRMVNGVDMYMDVQIHSGVCPVRMECGFDRKKPQQALLKGTDGEILVDLLHRPEGYTLVRNGAESHVSIPPEYDDMYGEIHHFVTLLEEGKKESPVMPLADSIEIARLSERIRRAAGKFAAEAQKTTL